MGSPRYGTHSRPRGTVKADPAAGTITVTGSRDVEFILAADTDYRLNFNPDTTDPKTYTGGDPVRIVNSEIDAAAAMPYTKLYDRHLADYKALYDRVDLEINPGQTFPICPLLSDLPITATASLTTTWSACTSSMAATSS